MNNHAKQQTFAGNGKKLSDYFSQRLSHFISPLLSSLDEIIDKRLIGTLEGLCYCLVRHRDKANALLLSELGGYLLGPLKSSAGTKRISNLLRSKKWDASEIDSFLQQNAQSFAQKLANKQQRLLLLYDESQLEKPESIKLEGLCAVRSGKSKRLTRKKTGYYNPPKGEVFVPGIWWMAAVVTTLGTSFQLAAQTWWTTRGDWTSDLKSERKALFDKMQAVFQGAIHVFDRGFCGAPWLNELFESKADFVMRWNSTYYLSDLQGSRKKAWQIAHGKKPKGQKVVWDAVRKKHRSLKILYFSIRHPKYPKQKLYLVVSRPGKGRKPWYLITNIKVKSLRSAIFIIRTYAKRWEIETMFRYMKSEFGIQSIRLWFWENRLKLLGILSVVAAFMLERLQKSRELVEILINTWCQRQVKRKRFPALPLYRFRIALAILWNHQVSLNSG